MTIQLADYFNRFDAAQNYEAHLFRADRVLQSAELNEVQWNYSDRIRRIADALFKDGDILKDARLIVDAETGAATAESGVVYLQGAMRGVPLRTFVVPVTGTVSVGIWLVETVVTEVEDTGLRDPAINVLNFGEPGAARWKREPRWGLATDAWPDGTPFFPIYTVIEGSVVPKQPPPQIDAIAQAITRYDRQSSGGYYVVTGMRVSALPDDSVTGDQLYSIQEGLARVNGVEVGLAHALRVRHAATPDLAHVDLEIYTATTSPQRINLYHTPLASVTQVLITRETSTILTRGVAGGSDAVIKNGQTVTGITSLTSIVQGETTYTPNTDYQLSADRIDWSPGGAEPSPGSTYTVTYRWVGEIVPTGIDATGFTVTDAVAGTQILVEYDWKLPRVDRICLGADGTPTVITGVARTVTPIAPPVPSGLLSLAQIRQTWTAARQVRNDGTRMVPMIDLERMGRRIDDLYALVGDERLKNDANAREPTAKRGLFVDPFLDDDLRDAGRAQTAAINGIAQELTLGATPHVVHVHLDGVQTLPETDPAVLIEQTLQTGSMLVNPYLAFDPLPGVARLRPATDFWIVEETQWLSPIIQRLTVIDKAQWEAGRAANEYLRILYGYSVDQWNAMHTQIVTEDTVETETVTVSRKEVALHFLRSIEIEFTLTGFGPGEFLNAVTFDGAAVTFTA